MSGTSEHSTLDPEALSEAEIAHLKKHLRRFTELTGSGRGFLRVEGESGQETIPLPASFLRVLVQALEEVAEGRPVSVAPADEELTTSEAAELLNVSRPYLVKLLEEKKIPHRKVGTHRRIRRHDVLAYKEKNARRGRRSPTGTGRPSAGTWTGVRMSARLVVLYDANVLYPAQLRDLLIRLAVGGLVRAHWTDAIHEEWIRNVLADYSDITREELRRTRRHRTSAAGGAD